MKIQQPYKIEKTISTALGDAQIICKEQDYYILFEDEESGFLSGFLYWWKNSDDIKDSILPEIKSVVDGRTESAEIGADVIGLAYIEPNMTRLIGSDVGYSDMELPTADFHGIVLEWLEFLEENGR
jgi:hypothetical protein